MPGTDCRLDRLLTMHVTCPQTRGPSESSGCMQLRTHHMQCGSLSQMTLQTPQSGPNNENTGIIVIIEQWTVENNSVREREHASSEGQGPTLQDANDVQGLNQGCLPG